MGKRPLNFSISSNPQNGNDPLVVRTEQLADFLLEWEKNFIGDRPRFAGSRQFGEQAKEIFMGARTFLSEHSGIPVRRIYAIIEKESQHVTFRTAEALLIAAGHEYLLSNGEIEVIANPRWSQERWQAYMAERGCI